MNLHLSSIATSRSDVSNQGLSPKPVDYANSMPALFLSSSTCRKTQDVVSSHIFKSILVNGELMSSKKREVFLANYQKCLD